MKVSSRHSAEVDVRAPVGVRFGVRENGRLTISAESGQSPDRAVKLLLEVAQRIREAVAAAEKGEGR
jgi:hypothetical protein